MTCKLCERPVVGRGFCRMHYVQMWRAGSLKKHRTKQEMVSLKDRLMAKVRKAPNGCWIWEGHHVPGHGYGLIWHEGRARRAHRAAFRLFCGPLNDDEVVCHRCDNPPCINPKHLFKGTRLENNRDAKAKGRNARGERNAHRKLSDADVLYIRAQKGIIPQSALAKHFKINQGSISHIQAYKRWKHLP